MCCAVGTHALEAGLYMLSDMPINSGQKSVAWWMLEDDQALLFGLWKHGYRRFDDLLGDTSLWLNRFEDAETRLPKATGQDAANMKTEEAENCALPRRNQTWMTRL
jgi:hypothetical protein